MHSCGSERTPNVEIRMEGVAALVPTMQEQLEYYLL